MAGTTKGGKRSAQGGRGSSHVSSPVAVENYLKGIDFPASKEDLVNQAKSNHAPEDVVRTIQRLPDKEYGSPIDISKEMKDM
jgi:hypothetical protein